jgi:hypothetical protein
MSDNAAIAVTLVLMVVLVAVAVHLIRRMAAGGIRWGGEVVVRCTDGHLYTTVWIPGGSFKAIRLGPTRFQHCPVGDHWAWVRPVDPDELNPAERRFAAGHHDRPVP